MNRPELTVLLARIQVLDNRQVDELTLQAWEPLVADIEYQAAVDAVNAHFRESTAYLLPAHIIARVRAARAALEQPTMSPEAPESCPDGRHRRLPDGTCLFCTDRIRADG